MAEFIVPTKNNQQQSNTLEFQLPTKKQEFKIPQKQPKEEVGFAENIYRTVVGAVRDTAQATSEFKDYLQKKIPYGNLLFPDLTPQSFKEELGITPETEKLPEIKEPTYFGGQLVRDIVGFALPYGATGKVTKSGKAIKEILIKSPLVEQIAFSPYEQRLSNLAVDALGTETAKKFNLDIAKPVVEYLQANPEDTESEARFKMALEGIATGTVFENILNTAKYFKNKIFPKVETPETKLKDAEDSPWGTSPSVKEKTLNENVKLDTQFKEPLDDILDKNVLKEVQKDPNLVGPQQVQKRDNIYRRKSDKIINYITGKLDPFSKMPMYDDYLKLRYRTLGRVAQVEDVSKKIYNTFSKATAKENEEIRRFLTNKDISPSTISNSQLRPAAINLKSTIQDIGNQLVKRGILPKEVVEANKGSYLPSVYLKYIDKDKALSYTKKKKDLDPEIKAMLGEIKEVEILGSKAVLRPSEDIIFFDFFDEIMKNSEWAYKPSLIKFKGKRVSSTWLKGEAERIRSEIRKDLRPREELRFADQMETLAEKADANIQTKDLSQFKQIPKTKKYGKLQGAYIRKEIYEDVISANEIITNKDNVALKILGDQGFVTKGTKLWKLSKVAMNPPTQIRNGVSNLILLHLSGVPLPKIPIRIYQAVEDIAKNGEYVNIAKKYGITQTSFNKQEILEFKRKMRKFADKEGVISDLKDIAYLYADLSSSLYQRIEEIGKIAKIIDEVKKGASDADAALAAQKTLFDYSLVPPSVRYLRNAPLGMPFLTFYYKVLPSLLETVIRRPYKFVPYVAIPYALHNYIADKYEVSKEEFDKFRKLLPEYIRNRGNAFVMPMKDEYGNWQLFDYSYFLPWSMFSSIAGSLKEGQITKALNDAGILSSPVVQLATALETNIDPFTNKPIVDTTRDFHLQIADAMLYLWNMASPPWLTETGVAGKWRQAIDKEVDMFGDPRITKTQAMLRGLGINLYPIDSEKSKQYNLYQFKKKYNDIIQSRNRRLRDKNLTLKERQNIIEGTNKQLEKLRQEKNKFIEQTNIPDKLKKGEE